MPRPFKHSMSPADHIIYVRWMRRAAALYASIAFLTVIGIAVAHYRGDGAQNQIVNLRPLHMN